MTANFAGNLHLSSIRPQAKFFKNYGWLEKNSADIRLSRIIAISKKYGWNSADYRYFFLNTAEGWCESIFQRRKMGSQCILELGRKFWKVGSHGLSLSSVARHCLAYWYSSSITVFFSYNSIRLTELFRGFLADEKLVANTANGGAGLGVYRLSDCNFLAPNFLNPQHRSSKKDKTVYLNDADLGFSRECSASFDGSHKHFKSVPISSPSTPNITFLTLPWVKTASTKQS